MLDLYSLFFGGTRKDAYRAITATLEKNAIIVSRRRAEKLPPLQEALHLCPEMLDSAYRALLNVLELTERHKENLANRGLSEDDIKRMEFRSIPQNGIEMIPKYLAKQGVILEGVPGFYFENGTPKMCTNGSGIYIPYRDFEGRILGLQIRYDVQIEPWMPPEQVKKLKDKRYRWLTSSSEKGGTSAQNIPFYGIPESKPQSVAYATEGGLKAAVAQSLSSGWFVAIPGITCFSAWEELLKTLKAQNVKTLVDAFDSDRATNENVKNSIQKLYDIAQDYGFEMKSWDWGTKYKGVDDYLLAKRNSREQPRKK